MCKLRALGVRMDVIVSSPLKRAWESAEIAAERLDYPKERIVVEELLIERGFGEGEGVLLDEMKERYSDSDCPGMESGEELVRRAGWAFQKITDDFKGAEQILLADTWGGFVCDAGGCFRGADPPHGAGGLHQTG